MTSIYEKKNSAEVRLLLKPGPGRWTRTLKNLTLKTWTLKNMEPEKHGPRKKWETSECRKTIRRPDNIIY